jgi:hypothetical protein
MVSTGSGTRTAYWRRAFPSAAEYSDFVCGFGLKTLSAPLDAGYSSSWNGIAYVLFYNAAFSATVCYLTISVDTLYPSIRNSAGTIIATSDRPVVRSAWDYFEIKVHCAGASSTIEMHMNGQEVIPSTGLTISAGGCGIIQFGCQMPLNCWYDDIYFLDDAGSAPWDDLLGDVRVETLYPTAEGANSDFTPSSGTDNALLVDESSGTYHDGDTTYVSSNVIGDKDTYVTSDLEITAGTIYAVQTCITAKKDDANLREVAQVIRQGGVDYGGAVDHALNASYLTYVEINEQDPTGSDWTVSSVNGNEYGIEVKS